MPPLPPPPDRNLDALALIEREKLAFEKEKDVRKRWLHEDCLVNQRITWLIQTQGVIGAAYAYLRYRVADVQAGLAPGILESKQQAYLDRLHQFERILQLVGMTSSVLLLIGVLAAFSAQHRLKRDYRDYVLGVSPGTTMWGHIAGGTIPAAAVLAWVLSWIV